MNKKNITTDNITAFFILLTTGVLLWIASVAQAMDRNLQGRELLLFLSGFVVSVGCMIARFVYSFYMALHLQGKIKKTAMIIYMVVFVVIYVACLWNALHSSGFSIAHQNLWLYKDFQINTIRILIVQWLGDRLFAGRR